MTLSSAVQRIVNSGISVEQGLFNDWTVIWYMGREMMMVSRERIEDEPLDWLAAEIEIQCHIRTIAAALERDLGRIVRGD